MSEVRYYEEEPPEYSLQVCVTHWRIYEAHRREPYAKFGFRLCPIEEGEEHEVVWFLPEDARREITVDYEAAATEFEQIFGHDHEHQWVRQACERIIVAALGRGDTLEKPE